MSFTLTQVGQAKSAGGRASAAPPRRRSWLLAIAGLGFLALSAIGGYATDVVVNGNFTEVRPGELYRSAQPSARDIADYANRYKIRTIVNLRGANAGKTWYETEVAAARQAGINHVDFPMSAKRELSQDQAKALVDLLRNAPKPILIHCQSGADRSGLAAALYLAAISRTDEATAEAQLSIRYGHLSIPLLSGYAMDRTFEKLEPWLGLEQAQTSKASIEG